MKITVTKTQEISMDLKTEVELGTYCCSQAKGSFKIQQNGRIGLPIERGGVFSFSDIDCPPISICPWCEEKIEREEILVEDENWMRRPKNANDPA